MEYTDLPYVKKKVSRIIYGTAIEPFMSGGDGNDLLDAVYETGVNTFDTARVYGDAEKSLGKWIEEREMREKVVILSKCGHPAPDGRKRINEKEIREDFAMSAEYLRTNYIDIYLLHRDDPDVPAGEIAEILNAMYAEGKIGAFGGSNWKHERIAEVNEYAYKHNLIPFTFSSPNFGLAEQVADPWGGGCVSISGPDQKAARDWYAKEQMAVAAYSSLAHGLFSGRVKSNEIDRIHETLDEFAIKGYACEKNFERLRRCEQLAVKKGCDVSQIAMAWLLKQELNVFAVVSTSKAFRMKENVDALYLNLSGKEMQFLNLESDDC